MRTSDIRTLTGKEVRGWYAWLRDMNDGCCCIQFASTDRYHYFVCMGWHDYGEEPDEERGFTDGFRVAWKIGRQTNYSVMQCDFDVDFEMPYVTEEMAKADPTLCEGDVDDTLEEVECLARPNHGFPYSAPRGYRGWDALASRMRKTARRVHNDWKDNDE